MPVTLPDDPLRNMGDPGRLRDIIDLHYLHLSEVEQHPTMPLAAADVIATSY